ncbi:MAG TPA: Smr/MutS family protein [Pseudolabrys sp.]|nr:Smr/MutS family protein [Pseudolabrys sp.]
MRPGDGNRRRVLSAEERVLWKTVTKSIAPLGGGLEADETAENAEPASTSSRRLGPAGAPLAKGAPPPLAPLGRRMRMRVARGKEAIDGRLDLHGLTQSEAHAALLNFLRTAGARGARIVLIITGKGGRGDSERGILKRQVPHWLGLPEFRAFIVGFEEAHIAHGGEGALYVRMRRIRA